MKQLAEDSRTLAKAIRAMRQRHHRAKWPKYEGQKSDTLQTLKEAAMFLDDAAKILEGAI